MDFQNLFKNICNELDLGSLLGQVKRVYGGYLHKMYCIKTDKGTFAVKMLNPEIMKRPDVFHNYRIAEELERKLQASKLPIISALEFNRKKMQCIDNQYFYVFNWINGKSLRSTQIKNEHCKVMGMLLAKIHKIEQKKETSNYDNLYIDWDFYINLSIKKCPEITTLLQKNRNLLYFRQEEGNKAFLKVPCVTSICNGDMDIKNVLWVHGKPKIIDLECLSYDNPYMELLQLALSWSGHDDCCVNYDLLKAFIRSYIGVYGKLKVDWNALYCANISKLEWLEYNVKRALMIECQDEEEQKLGIDQVRETINQIIYYNKIKEPLLEQLWKL